MATISGGDKVVARLKEIASRAGGKADVKVGFLKGRTYPDGTSVALVAYVNEYGRPSKGQPPRPFFRNMIAADSPQWGDQTSKILEAANYDAHLTMDRVGFLIERQLVVSIKTLTSPPLAESTIRRKGFDKPLIHTGWMWKSVSHQVIS